MATPAGNSVPLLTATNNNNGTLTDEFISGLLQGGSWTFGGGPRVITYSLNLNDDGYGGPWTSDYTAAFQQALASWSNVANISFVQIFSGTYYYESSADITATLTGNDLFEFLGAVALGVFPDPVVANGLLSELGYDRSFYPFPEGDVFFDNYTLGHTFSQGTSGYEVMLHELGHALGLKHPQDNGASGPDGRPTFSQLLIADYATVPYTLMSGEVLGSSPYAVTPLLLDILAIQQIYGANNSYNTGDNTYFYSTSSHQAIWDAGGIDTIDGSTGYGIRITLSPGEFVQPVSGSSAVTAIAYGVTIENAIGSMGDDIITGNSVSNLLYGRYGIDTLYGLSGADTLHGEGDSDNLYGGEDDDTLYGGEGNDLLDGGPGQDEMSGGPGNDIFVVDSAGDVVTELAGEGTDLARSSVSHTLGAALENLELTGNANINGTGNEFNNTIVGNSGNNVLDGGNGKDRLEGGTGNDTYILNDSIGATYFDFEGDPGDYISGGQRHFGDPGAGSFTVQAHDMGGDSAVDTVTVLYYSSADNWTLQFSTRYTGLPMAPGVFNNAVRYPFDSEGQPGLDISGNGRGSNTLTGSFTVHAATFSFNGSSWDVLDFSISYEQHSEGGIPALRGVLNIDYPDNTGTPKDDVIELADGGIDLVMSGLEYALPQHVENLTLTGSNNVNGTGNSQVNQITGNAGNNILNGLGGADIMAGLAGNDTYMVDQAGDQVIEALNAGSDFVRSTVSWTLSANVEELQLLGSNPINGTGNGLNNWIQGNAAANILNGLAGADAMIGLGGNDTYFVDHAGDKTVEALNAGSDFVRSTINWTLMAHTEELQLLGSDPISGTGNELNNWIQGNSAANVLDGKAGADAMIGLGGNDTYMVDHAGDKTIEAADGGSDFVRSAISWTLMAHTEELQLLGSSAINGTGNELNNWIQGNSAANVLDGKAGADAMIGLGGNDTYFVDHVGDKTIEAASAGVDFVRSTISWTLMAHTEELQLLGVATINGTGNELNNWMQGNSAANVLDGKAGNDSMIGLGGNDTYIVDSVSDKTVEAASAGTDFIRSSVSWTLMAHTEELQLLGGSPINGTGNELNNWIMGNSAANILDGKAGNDSLITSGGADIVGFSTALGPTNIDRINDFSVVDDTIQLAASVFTALAPGALGANAFLSGAGITSAADADDRIIYNSSTGALYYDADGVGGLAAQQFAVLTGNPALLDGNFFVI